MPEWDTAQYLKFNDERTQPCWDLAARVSLAAPANIIDLGCGPGNSTEVVAARFGIAGQVREWFTHETEFYYDALAAEAERVEVWTTEYLHVMPGVEAIVEWYKGTGMRPFLEALPDDAARGRFTTEYLEAIRGVYEARRDGRVLFPFRRVFVVAYR